MRLFRKAKPTGRRPQLPGVADRPSSSMKYYSRRSDQDLNTGRQLEREKRRPLPGSVQRFWLQRFGLIVLSLAVIACVVDVLNLTPHSHVQTLGSNQLTLVHTPATYQAAADKLLAASIWNHNKITVNTAQVARQLQLQFPELTSVTVSIPLLAHQPIVYIEPAQPAILMIATNGAFLLDQHGSVVLSVPDIKSVADLQLPQVIDQSGLQLKRGQQGLTSGNVAFIQTIVAELKARQINVTTLTLPATSSEVDANIVGQTYLVKFNLANDTARQQAGTFLATKAHLDGQHVTPSQYVDVRVDGRAYYK